MKKIRVINWAKWKRTIRPETLRKYLALAYRDHFENLFLWSEDLESFLKEKDIDYEIDTQDYIFQKPKKTKS
jgi:hypothetical protein